MQKYYGWVKTTWWLKVACIFYPTLVFSQFHEKVVWKSFDWQVIHSPHFDIHYPEGYEFLGNKCAEIAEEANLYVSEKLTHDLSEVIPVYIYPSPGYFQMTNIIPSGIDEAIGGLTESTHKRIIVPYSGSYDELRHTLSHEIVHAFQYDLILSNNAGELVGIYSQPSTPLWLIEGMAEYYSIGWDSQTDMILRDAVLTDTMPSLQDMTDYRIINPMIFYKGGQAVLQYIALTYGESKIPELLRDSRDQKNFKNAIKTNFGISMDDFNKGWQLWLKRLYFDDVNKKSSFETGHQATSHLQDKSIINLYPSISPDGKKISYLSVRNYNPVIVMRDVKNFPREKNYQIAPADKPTEDIVLRSGESEEFYQLHLIDNNISFTPDSKYIFFAARSYGKDILYLYDYQDKKIIKSWTPDVDMIQYPELSHDGKNTVFVGSRKGKTDVYLLNLVNGSLRQITSDYFAKKNPVFSEDDKTIYYSGNQVDSGDIENKDYDIFTLSLETGKVKRLLSLKGNQEKPRILKNRPDTILFISDHEGALNAYEFNIMKASLKSVTDSFNGVLSIQPDEAGQNFILSVYDEQGYDIAILNRKDYAIQKKDNARIFRDFIKPQFPSNVFFLNNLKTESYKARISLDAIFFGLEYSSYYGFGGFAFFSMSEYMGDHNLTGMFDFVASASLFNFYLDYVFKKYRMNLHAGIFRASSYYSILNLLDLTSINNIVNDPNQFTKSMYRFGGYLSAVYPWTSFLYNAAGLEVYKYDEIFRDINNPTRLNINTNIFAITAAMNFNNTLYSYDGPLKGTYFNISDRQTLNITGKDFVYNSFMVDFRQYFNLFERYIIAIRALGGIASGPQKSYFPYLIGGPFTMRGYDFLSLEGIYTFLMNLELRLPMVDYIVFGFPVQWIIRGFTAVLFMDIGSAFNDVKTWTLYNNTTKTLQDLKASFGLGIRVLLVPGISLRFDWATPWDLKKVLPLNQWKFNFSLGYEY